MLAAAATFAATAAAAKAEARDESDGREEGEEASPLLREEGEGRKTCSAREGGTPTWHTRP